MAMTESLEKMLADGRDDAMLRFGLGSAYFNDKNYSAAIPHLQACLQHDEHYSAAYKLLGRSLAFTDKQAQAKTIFEKGLVVSAEKGDKQTEKEITVFLKKLD